MTNKKLRYPRKLKKWLKYSGLNISEINNLLFLDSGRLPK